MSVPRKDFGKGFYVTNIRSQAKTWVKRIGADNKSEGVVTERRTNAPNLFLHCRLDRYINCNDYPHKYP